MFIDALDVDDVLAHLLVAEGFSSVEDVAFVPMVDLLNIEGFDQDLADELRDRARASFWSRRRSARPTAAASWESPTSWPRSTG